MKKVLLFIGIIVSIVLSGCTATDEIVEEEFLFHGTYSFYENVYSNPIALMPLSGINPEWFTTMYYIEFNGNEIIYSDFNGIVSYDNIEFREVQDMSAGYDEVFSLNIEGLFDEYDTRYDIYSNDNITGLTVFLKGQDVFIAKSQIFGDTKEIATLWGINEVKREVIVDHCEQAIHEIMLSGVFYTYTKIQCETNEYRYNISIMEYLDGAQLLSGNITVWIKGASYSFWNCIPGSTPLCDGNWNLVVPGDLSDITEDYSPEERSFALLDTLNPSIDVFDLKNISLDWFQPIDDTFEHSGLIVEYDLVSMEEYKDEIYELFFDQECEICSNEERFGMLNMYLKLDQEGQIKKIYYSVFPTHTIEFVDMNELFKLPDEIINQLHIE